MQKFIAIDNVCAWPNIKLLPNGEVMAVVFNQPCHLVWEGTVDCWVSADRGRMWEFRSHPVINEPTTNRGNVAVGVMNDGKVMVLCSGWSNVAPKPRRSLQGGVNDDTVKANFAGRLPLWPVCSVSSDNGVTWQTKDVQLEGIKPDSLWIPYGDILTLDSGNLGCSMYGCDKSAFSGDGHKLGSFYFESSDGGWSWTCRSRISVDGNETALVKLPSGKLLAAVRSEQLDLFESTDGGGSWSHVRFLTGRRQYPGAFTILQEGYLLLTHGIRNNGLYGVGGQLMNLDDEKWYHLPFILNDFECTCDGGYPSNVQFPDGEIVTAYYSSEVPFHQRYHMGVMTWRLEDIGIKD